MLTINLDTFTSLPSSKSKPCPVLVARVRTLGKQLGKGSSSEINMASGIYLNVSIWSAPFVVSNKTEGSWT